MRYVVVARNWDGPFSERFGEQGSEHEFSDDEVIAHIIDLGRAQIEEAPNRESKTCRLLYFQNDYD